jgi:hypothetical protein
MAAYHPEDQWLSEVKREEKIGLSGIQKLLSHYPDFYTKINKIRQALEIKTNRPLKIGVIDFKSALWVDFGLHHSLRRNIEIITNDSPHGNIIRDLFGISKLRNQNGNTIINSKLSMSADIKNSVMIDSEILDNHCVIRNGLIVGSKLKDVTMPHGGCILFCAANRVVFDGAHAIAFRSVVPEIILPEGGSIR